MERVEYHPIVIQDLINLHRAGELDINPWYQRRAVWTTPQKAYLINTLFEKKPIPSIYIRHYLNIELEKSIKEVVDGQQRIRTILEYVNDEYAARHPAYNKRIKYSQLGSAEKTALKMTSLSVGYLIEADDADVIEIFGRLNSISKTLNAQEKRNAKFSGEVKQFCLRQAAMRVHLWRDLGIFSANDIARMKEVLFISDLTYNLLHGLSDFRSANLDNFYKKYDNDFPQMQDLTKRMEKVFQTIATLDPKSIKDTIFSRIPLFFSLIIVLDGITRRIPKSKIEDALFLIDKNFNSDTPVSQRTKKDSEFYFACTASTQRIKSRKKRDQYIREHLGF